MAKLVFPCNGTQMQTVSIYRYIERDERITTASTGFTAAAAAFAVAGGSDGEYTCEERMIDYSSNI